MLIKRDRKTNLLINGFADDETIEILKQAISGIDYRNAYKLYYRNPLENNLSKIELIDCGLAIESRITADWSSLIPLERSLIEKMSNCEAITMRMMDRFVSLESFYYSNDLDSYGARKQLYLKYLRYWNDFLETKKITLFISSNIPHEGYDYIIYCLCKLKGIKTLFLHQSQIEDTVLLLEDIDEFDSEIAKHYEKIVREKREPKLKGRFLKHFQRQVTENPTPFYMTNDTTLLKSLSTIKGLLANNIDLRRQKISRERIKNGIAEKKLCNAYKKLSEKPGLARKYIYLPLHYQPELTTCPLAGPFVDQLLIAAMISHYLPKDTYLYIKEHPKQKIVGRYPEFYNDLVSLSKVKLVPQTFNTYSLIENSIAVATATGTAGWEALFKGKPVLLFGSFFYQSAPGVMKINSNEDCRKSIKAIAEGSVRANKQDLRKYLVAVERSSIHGYIDTEYKKISSLSKAENLKNVSEGINLKIKVLSERMK